MKLERKKSVQVPRMLLGSWWDSVWVILTNLLMIHIHGKIMTYEQLSPGPAAVRTVTEDHWFHMSPPSLECVMRLASDVWMFGLLKWSLTGRTLKCVFYFLSNDHRCPQVINLRKLHQILVNSYFIFSP